MANHNDIPCAGNASARPRHKKSEFITVRVSWDVKDQLAATARQRNRPLSWLVNSVLEQFVSDQAKVQRE